MELFDQFVQINLLYLPFIGPFSYLQTQMKEIRDLEVKLISWWRQGSRSQQYTSDHRINALLLIFV